MGGDLKMIGYENNTSHPGYKREMDYLDREDAIDLRAEQIAAEIIAAPYEADDLYYAIDHLSDHEQTKLARLIERIDDDGFATLRAAMDTMRERRAEEQGERIAREEMNK
jgi:ribosome-associated translation inhibitor RaiA